MKIGEVEKRFAIVPVKVFRIVDLRVGRLLVRTVEHERRIWMTPYLRWQTPYQGIKLIDIRDAGLLK